jgi:hypothetical protein
MKETIKLLTVHKKGLEMQLQQQANQFNDLLSQLEQQTQIEQSLK